MYVQYTPGKRTYKMRGDTHSGERNRDPPSLPSLKPRKPLVSLGFTQGGGASLFQGSN